MKIGIFEKQRHQGVAVRRWRLICFRFATALVSIQVDLKTLRRRYNFPKGRCVDMAREVQTSREGNTIVYKHRMHERHTFRDTNNKNNKTTRSMTTTCPFISKLVGRGCPRRLTIAAL